MHLLDRYSLATGLKIDKPFIYEKYFPLSVQKYITINFVTKDSKTYDYGQEVVNILYDIFNPLGYTIVQIGDKNEKPFINCYHTFGQTTINQLAYIIKNSSLHIGVDSFSSHLAGHYNIPCVILFSNNYIDCCKPFWGNKDNQIFIEPFRKQGIKPSFSFTENPKSINTIAPEKIAEAAVKLKNISYNYQYKTVLLGIHYYHKLIEMYPDQPVDPRQFNSESIIIRMDYNFNLEVLKKQLQISKCTIVTDKEIDVEILKNYKNNIMEIVCLINDDSLVNFVNNLFKLNFRFTLLSYKSEEEVNKLKIHYMEKNLIIKKEKSEPEIISKNPDKKFYYKSSKLILAKNKFYPSYSAFLKNKPVDSFMHEPIEIEEDDKQNLWQDIEFLYILTK